MRLVAIGTGSSLASSVTTWLIFRKGPGDGEFTVETQYVDYDLEGHGIERILPLLRPEGQYVMDAGPLVRKVVSGLSKLAAAEEAVEKALVTA